MIALHPARPSGDILINHIAWMLRRFVTREEIAEPTGEAAHPHGQLRALWRQ